MKKLIFTLVLIILIAPTVSAQVEKNETQGIHFFKGTWDEALAKAKAENKLIFMDCYSSWCGPCKGMEKNVFTLPEVGDYYNENFINVKYNMEKDYGIELSKRYNVMGYPTWLFINHKGFVVAKDAGSKKPDVFIDLAKKAVSKKNTIPYEERFLNGDRDAVFMKEYLTELVNFQQFKLVDQILNQIFEERKGDMFNDKIYWNTFVSSTICVDYPMSLYVVANNKKLSKMYGKEVVEDKIRNMYTIFINILALCKGETFKAKPDYALVEEYYKKIRERKVPHAESIINEVQFVIDTRMNGDYDNAVKVADVNLKKADSKELYRWADVGNKFLTTRESRDIAAKWAERALAGLKDEELREDYQFLHEDLKNNMKCSMSYKKKK